MNAAANVAAPCVQQATYMLAQNVWEINAPDLAVEGVGGDGGVTTTGLVLLPSLVGC
jgi:hypothetical protein